jgi:hypothetical protein
MDMGFGAPQHTPARQTKIEGKQHERTIRFDVVVVSEVFSTPGRYKSSIFGLFSAPPICNIIELFLIDRDFIIFVLVIRCRFAHM